MSNPLAHRFAWIGGLNAWEAVEKMKPGSSQR